MLALSLLLFCFVALDPPTDVTVDGHIFRPSEVKPTDELIAKRLHVPDGFKIAKFAEGLGKPRMLAVADDGTVFVSRRQEGDVLALIDRDGDGKCDEVKTAWKLPDAHGLAIHDGKLYVATINEVFAAPIEKGGSLGSPKKILDGLPDAGQHPNRTIAFGPNGFLYISVGSTANGAWESNKESATILQALPDGPGRNVVATGLRNTIGFAWHPITLDMWGMDHGYDWMGDDIPPEELNRIRQGGNYGWPFLWADNQPNPERDPKQYGVGTYDEWQKKCLPVALTYPAHSAPMAMLFYTGKQFPAEFTSDAFIAMHGSWNRKTPTGYEVVRLRFDPSGKPLKFEPFLNGFLSEDKREIIGRPVGLAIAKDGSLLISDDSQGVIYRVSYDRK